jgi:predicted nucleotide-binding protein (sugar kinase/HSP70/actin superfamily)
MAPQITEATKATKATAKRGEALEVTASGIELLNAMTTQPFVPGGGYAEIEDELRAFEEAERKRLGLEEEAVEHWHDENPKEFTASQRDKTTILAGGLTFAHDVLVEAALGALGYRMKALDVPDNAALRIGKEFGNRGQCNPTYFTVGNLVKHLMHLRDEEGLSAQEIKERYLFVTAGACGPCRFGSYVTEYRKALRDAGFEGFRVLLFQQQGGLKQATGDDPGLDFNPAFFKQILKAVAAGDVLNAMGYRIRPYEVEPGATDAALARCRQELRGAFTEQRSILRALRRCKHFLDEVQVDRLQPKPKVMIIGEFWAMTTEGDGNYHLQRFLEQEGAEVDIQLVTAWLLYNIWINQHDTRRRMRLRGVDGGRQGLENRDPAKKLALLWVAEKLLRGMFGAMAKAIGLKGYKLPDMDANARAAREHYWNELRGGEGHMEVGKVIQCVKKKKAHMVVSVKPFGCMPSSGVSDGVQSLVVKKYPEAIFCPIETTGDGAVNVQSRVQMFLFKARRKARAELDAALAERGWSADEARGRVRGRRARSTWYPPHADCGTATNVVRAL